MDTIDDVVATAEAEWRAYGVLAADRATLAADLRNELEAAATDGITPGHLLGDDVRGFARRLADESGVARAPREYRRVLRTALTGAVLGTALGFVVLAALYPAMVRMFDLPRGFRIPVLLAVFLYYGTAAALAVAGAVVAVRTRLRDLPRAHATGRAMSVMLPLAGALITPVTIMFAWSTDYATTVPVVLAEMAMAIGGFAGATVLARRWALRDRTGKGTVRAA